METQIRFDRLALLADHLETGTLGHERFHFDVWNYASYGRYDANGCGTAGCAIGECPIIWPDEWEFTPALVGYNPTLKEPTFGGPIASAMKWFGLTDRQADHLFVADCQHCDEFDGCRLSPVATRYQVAANIREFISRMQP